MSMSLDDYDDRRAEQREQRLRALGTRSPRCRVLGCTEVDPFALTGVAPDILCREHEAEDRGCNPIEDHHVAGRHNDPLTVPALGNDHGALSELQALWPRETLRNPRGSPLLGMAAWVRGWLDIHRVIIDRAVGRIPDGLERLDAVLTKQGGPRWWETLGWRW